MTDRDNNISIIVWLTGSLIIFCMFLFFFHYTDHPKKQLPFSNQARQCKTLFLRVSQACQSISPTNDPPGRAKRTPSIALASEGPAEPSLSSPGRAKRTPSIALASEGPAEPSLSSPGRAKPPAEPSPHPNMPAIHCPLIDTDHVDRAVRAAVSPTYTLYGNYLSLTDALQRMDQEKIDQGIDVVAEGIAKLQRMIALHKSSALEFALMEHGEFACSPYAAEPANIVNTIMKYDIEKLMEYNKHRLWLIEQAKYPWRNYDPKLKARVAAMSTEDRFALINQESEILTHLHRLMWGRDVDIIYMTAPVWPYRPTTRLIYDTRNHMPAKKD